MPKPNGHVLIIEDEPVIALELEALLGDLGYATFDFADCPEEALDHARARRPALITADFRLRSGTGVEAVQMISLELGAIPVIFVTGNPDLLPAQVHIRVVDKPISAVALAAACATVLSRSCGSG